MYRSIQELGEIFDREEQANTLVKEFQDFYEEYKRRTREKTIQGADPDGTSRAAISLLPKIPTWEVLWLWQAAKMFIQIQIRSFLQVNTEDMKTKDRIIILRAAHALPDQVVEMFNEDFKTNDIWKHFDAVKNGRVYDLTYENFGMSATFRYPKALDELQPILYPESDEDLEKAKKNSENAQKNAEKSNATQKYEDAQKSGTSGKTVAEDSKKTTEKEK